MKTLIAAALTLAALAGSANADRMRTTYTTVCKQSVCTLTVTRTILSPAREQVGEVTILRGNR